jgi:CRISPR-associated protein Csm1
MTEVRQETLQAALAGLLHDIGKFAQRAGIRPRESMDHARREEVKYEHALLSYDFAQEYTAGLTEEVRHAVGRLVYHHVPQTDADERLRLADWLAAGERDEIGETQPDPPPLMRSVFSRLHGFDEPWYVSLKRLSFDEDTLFPVRLDNAARQSDHRACYQALWQEFTAACAPLKTTSDPVVFLEILYNRLLEFTWCVPGAYYRAVPDVSLFDHCRMTAAVAACLAVDGRDGAWCRAVADEEPAATLVAGDISGVQDFIYTLASSGAAKTLRGRSFYIQLLTEVVADFILHRLGLPITNLLYAGGGNFFLMAGVSQQVQLEGLRREVTQRLVAAHRGALHLTLAWKPVERGEFRCGAFSEAWRQLHEDCLLPQKYRPLAALPEEELLALVGTPQGVGGDNDQTCSVCGAERQKGEYFDTEEAGAERVRKCDLCQSFETLGRTLAEATHWVMVRAPVEETAAQVRSWQTGIANFGARVALVNHKKPLENANALPVLNGATLARVSSIGDMGVSARISAALQTVPIVEVVRPLAQLVPRDRYGYPVTTDDLADRSPSDLKRWGVLRMDVDNLGQVFRSGFRGADGDTMTLSRLASLSLALRLFFEGAMPLLARPQGEGDTVDLRDCVYLQYAGGDDLFVVGTWDALPRFGARIRRKFSDYVCHNPAITLSGGVTLADKRYPLYQAARDAEKAEKAAKAIRPEKNAFTFLSQPVRWEDFDTAMERADTLADWLNCRDAPKSLLQTLNAIASEYARTNRDGKLFFGRWMWMLAYQLSRAAARAKDNEVKHGIVDLCNSMLTSRGLMRTIGLSARWAELLTRGR